MKVFLAESSFDPRYGGPAFHAPAMASALVRAGAEVGVWTRDSTALEYAGWRYGKPARCMTGRVDEAIRAFGRPDIIHAGGIWLPHYHAMARISRSMGVPRVVKPAGSLLPWAFGHKAFKKKVAWHLYQRRDLATAQLLLASSEWEAEHLRRLRLPAEVAVLPHGVDRPDLPAMEPRVGTKKVAVFVGRLHAVKGLPMLVAAWGRARPPDWELRIAGPDEKGHRAEIELAVAKAGLGDVVTFLGQQDGVEKSRVLLESDLFILPSYSESFGNVVSEALFHGLPVLTTTGTPWRELPGKGCGWQVPATVDGLESALRVATGLDRAQLRAMGAKGREWVLSEFNWDAIAKRQMDIYSEVSARYRAGTMR